MRNVKSGAIGQTDQNGKYKVSKLRAGENTTIKAVFPGSKFKDIENLNLNEGDNLSNINFQLKKNKSLLIKVVDQTTKAIIKDAYILLSDMDGNNIPCYSNENGEFNFYNLGKGNCSFIVLHPNYEPFQKEVVLAEEIKEILVELNKAKED